MNRVRDTIFWAGVAFIVATLLFATCEARAEVCRVECIPTPWGSMQCRTICDGTPRNMDEDDCGDDPICVPKDWP